MMRRVCLWAVVAVIAAGSWAPASAQASGDKWNVFVAPYLMGAAMSGTTAVRGVEVDVDMSASDIFSKLQFGAMGLAIARKGNWGLGGDFIWMSLGANGTAPGPVGVTATVDMSQGAFAFYGLRRLGPAADVFFGARINTLQGTITFKGPGTEVDDDKTWVDPIVGLLLRTPDERRFQLRLFTEIGGFGAGSNFAWQAFPTVGFRLTRQASLEFGYRWLDIDYESGEGPTCTPGLVCLTVVSDKFAYDVLSQGPVLGFGFRF
jgi:hypothetical protein